MPRPIVYVVDDEPMCLQPMCTLVNAFGYEASAFDNAAALLDSIGDEENAMIFADLRMPGMNGLELFENLKEAGHSYPFILVSGHADEELVRRAMHAGVSGYLAKPLDIDEFERTIDEHLDGNESEK